MEYKSDSGQFAAFNKESILASLKPIETRYNGYHFRSRTEARWAVLFDALGIKYEYEKEGYELICGPYLPDFWLPFPNELNFSGYPGAGNWIEIKGCEPSQDELSKLLHLSIETKHSANLLWGTPWNFKRYFTHRHGNCGWSDKFNPNPFENRDDTYWDIILMFHNYNVSFVYEAIGKSKSARFEHGEKP
jgi:hypothetical protein